MAPSQDDPRNPFESFRRFADDQMSSFMRSLTGQTSNTPKSKPSAPESTESDEDLPWIVRGMSQEARRRYRDVQRHINEFIAEDKERLERAKREKYQDGGARCPYRPADQVAAEHNQVTPTNSIQERAEEAGCPAFPKSDSSEHQPQNWAYFGPSWLIGYLHDSTYSPTHLEKEPTFEQYGQKWRQAFEDLLAIQTGAEFEEPKAPQPQQCTEHWISSMANRGLFGISEGSQLYGFDVHKTQPDLLRKDAQARENSRRKEEKDIYEALEEICSALNPWNDRGDGEDRGKSKEASDYVRRPQRFAAAEDRVRKSTGLVEDHDETDDDFEDDEDEEYDHDEEDQHQLDDDENEEATELDQYRQLFGMSPFLGKDLIDRLATQAFREESTFESTSTSTSTSQPQPTEDGKPSIISTLTTTERTTLPDGSVHTKMVLKKRFADGREESNETTQTSRGQQVRPEKKEVEAKKDEKPGAVVEVGKTKAKGKGWFWS